MNEYEKMISYFYPLWCFHTVWKSRKMYHFNFWILAFSTHICPIEYDLSGNTIWPQASGSQKLAKRPILGILLQWVLFSKKNINCGEFCKIWPFQPNFYWTFVHSLLCSQCWMRLFSVIDVCKTLKLGLSRFVGRPSHFLPLFLWYSNKKW